MGYVISFTTNNRKRSYWQTPWLVKCRVLGDDGKPVYNAGYPVFMYNDDGTVMWREIGGEVFKKDWATVYDTEEEAQAVNAIRYLDGEVEAV